MSRYKVVAPGSPFNFLSPREQLAPLMKDVKVATITFDPSYTGRGRGLLLNVLKNIEGRVHRRLSSSTEIVLKASNTNEPAILHLDYGEGIEKEVRLYRGNIRDLMFDVWKFREDNYIYKTWKYGHTIYHDVVLTEDDSDHGVSNSKKKDSKKGGKGKK